MTTTWSRDSVAKIARLPMTVAPSIDLVGLRPILPGFDLWDYWPVQEEDGRTATIAGGTLQMLLS